MHMRGHIMNKHMEKFFHQDTRIVGPSTQHRAAKALLLAVAMTLGTGCTSMLAQRQHPDRPIPRPDSYLLPQEKALLDRIEADAKKHGYQVLYLDEGRPVYQIGIRMPKGMTPLKPMERAQFAEVQSRLGDLAVRVMIVPSLKKTHAMKTSGSMTGSITVGRMVGNLIDQGVGFTQRAVTATSRAVMGMGMRP